MVCGRFPFVKRTAVMVVGNGGVESGCRCMTRKAGRWPLAPSATNTCLMPWGALVDHVGPLLGESATAYAPCCRDHSTTTGHAARRTSAIEPLDGTSTPSR